jgi:hypothetical protein
VATPIEFCNDGVNLTSKGVNISKTERSFFKKIFPKPLGDYVKESDSKFSKNLNVDLGRLG